MRLLNLKALALLPVILLPLSGCQTLAAYQAIPDNYRVLFWSQEKREKAAISAQDYSEVATIAASGTSSALPVGAPLQLKGDIESYFEIQDIAGLIVLHKGEIRFEKYALSLTPEAAWSSFSIAKSVTSTLVGAAIKDGYIESLESQITSYIPELKGTAYEGVTIRHLLTMTSGVGWDENYSDIKSDIAQFIAHKPDEGLDVTLSYMRKLKRVAPVGEQFNYSTGETNLAGILVAKATGKTLAAYLSEKIWKPYGMEADAIWALSPTGEEIGGCCISARLRDYARFGQFMLDGAKINGVSIVPDDWVEQATTTQKSFNQHRGYGYLWWTYANQSYVARGIFGQQIAIIPSHDYVTVILSNWPKSGASEQVLKNKNKMQSDIAMALFPDEF